MVSIHFGSFNKSNPNNIDTCLLIAKDALDEFHYVLPFVGAGVGPLDHIDPNAIAASTSDGRATVIVCCFQTSGSVRIMVISLADDSVTAESGRNNVRNWIAAHDHPVVSPF